MLALGMALAGLVAVACVTVGPAPTVAPPQSVALPTIPPITSPRLTLPAPAQTLQPPTLLPPTRTAAITPTVTLPPPPTSGAIAPASPGEGSVGEKIRVADYQYVTMAEAEWSDSGYQEFFEPAEGNVLYAFLMEFEGIDPEGSSYNPFYFKLNADGFEYSYYLFGKEPTLQSGDLTPGATVRGWLTFEAPLADTVLLKYEPIFGLGRDTVEWTVTVNQ